jgi:hypothetical protein
VGRVGTVVPPMSAVLISRATTGEVVAEADLSSSTVTVAELLETARRAGASLVWAHGGDLSEAGFQRTGGFVQLHIDWKSAAMTHPEKDHISVLAGDAPADPKLLTLAFLGQWGHKQMEDVAPAQDDGSVVLTMLDAGVQVGICQMWPEARIIDGPGLVPSARSAAGKVALLKAACTLLGTGPIQVDTWGEDDATIAAYATLGFSVGTTEPGWERRMPATP